ncbi:hypothetical protein OTU49_013223, partial [Cherax quadricarinatus]
LVIKSHQGTLSSRVTRAPCHQESPGHLVIKSHQGTLPSRVTRAPCHRESPGHLVIKSHQGTLSSRVMRINKAYLPLKAHYFCFFGCTSPIIPFLVVIGVQLGIPVSVMGTFSAVLLILVMLMKPVVATLADAFPSYRHTIFLLMLGLMVTCYSSLAFVPPLRAEPRVAGQLVDSTAQVAVLPVTDKPGLAKSPLLLSQDDGGCYIALAWDCIATCQDPWSCYLGNKTTPDLRLSLL